MNIIGLNSIGYITSATLLRDGKIVAGCAEERLDRQKRSREFPLKAINYCLEEGKIKFSDVDAVAVSWNAGINLEKFSKRFSGTFRHIPEILYSTPNHLLTLLPEKEVEYIEEELHLANNKKMKIYFVDHHLSHAALSFFLSGFEKAAIFTADAFGERTTTMWATGEGNKISPFQRTKFPQSLGSLYSTFTEFLGFRPDSDEWKVMGASAYGDAKKYSEQLKKVVKLTANGNFELDLSYFNYYNFDQPGFFSEKIIELFGEPRKRGEKLEQRHYDIAASLQLKTEELLFHAINHLYEKTKQPNLCLSGGVIMNSVFNGQVVGKSKFSNVYIPSAPDDSGNSTGSALYLYYNLLGNKLDSKQMHKEFGKQNYFGPEWSNEELEKILKGYKIPYSKVDNIAKKTAQLIADNNIVGWFQGRMEFGQRALGNRSILADVRDKDMKDKVNARIKFREEFRPFAPSILQEKVEEYFEIEPKTEVPFMEKVYFIKEEKRKVIPAVTHEDGTGRLQTVEKKINPLYYELIKEFDKLTGVPVILNTSFNLNMEPIVCKPLDAIRTFNTCGLDYLVLGNCLIGKGQVK